MTFITHEKDPELSISGTCLQGYVIAPYHKILELFGRPMEGDGYKTDVEWIVRFEDGLIATIYNWKNGPAYCGDGMSVSLIDEWNIGGTSKDAVERITQLIESARS